MNLALKIISIVAIAYALSACKEQKPATDNKPQPTTPVGIYTECKDPRPQACTREYRPVCGKVDTGVRCVTEPCPSTELKTYGNACTACADTKVFGYWPNACPE